MTLKLQEMTIEEKLRTMELLWDDICREIPDLAPPKWHADILKDREKKIQQGQDEFIDWEQAKMDIRDSIS